MASFLDLIRSTKDLNVMDYLVVTIVSILILALLVLILLLNSKTGKNFKLSGKTLTIWHPLKKEEINLEKDLRSWKVRRINLLWRKKLFALNLELKSGVWKKIYFRSRTEQFKQLVATLGEVSPKGRI
ncbi:hypothetical protein GCM10009119_38060 [Algoriphagus jejuensis]|uniref:PH (Pleckstrin Homology) domain-containing protein n=1 Tax=Algoriphagus jejuensis TaxID=419934 RepID=A0ABP3YKQ4_9BACT